MLGLMYTFFFQFGEYYVDLAGSCLFTICRAILCHYMFFFFLHVGIVQLKDCY